MGKTIEEFMKEGVPEKRPRDRKDNLFFKDTYLEKNPFRFCPWCGAEGVKNYWHTHDVDGATVHKCLKCDYSYTIVPLNQSEVD